MARLELTPAEAEVLREVVEKTLVDLRREIAHTDSREYRDQLRWRESLLGEVLERLGAPATASPR
jgi:hypothetical protein